MAQWINATATNSLHPGEHTVIETAIGPIALFHLGERIVAIEDRCSHDGGELACGRVQGNEITCPRHSARFSLLNGEALSPPAYEAIACYPLREHNGILQIDIDT